MEDDLKARFLKIYANMPLQLRDNIVLTLGENNEPITWRAAFIEINNDSERSAEILKKLVALNLI